MDSSEKVNLDEGGRKKTDLSFFFRGIYFSFLSVRKDIVGSF